MASFDPAAAEWFQDKLASLPGDEHLVPLTVRQLQKIVAIIGAGQRGHTTYLEHLEIVGDFLEATAFETLRDKQGLDYQGARSAADLWRILDDLPWPVPGPPQNQPDAS